MGTEEQGLEPGDRRVPRRQVGDRLEPDDSLDRGGGHEAAHARTGARVVVDVDDVDVPRRPQGTGELEHRMRVASAWRVDLDRDDELTLAELPLQDGLALGLARRDDDLALADDEPRARAAILVDRVPDGGDLHRRRPAAASDDARSELACVRRELREVLGRRVREDDALAREAREADVRESR